MRTPKAKPSPVEKMDRGGRPNKYDETEPMDPDAYQVQHNMVNGLSTNMKQLVLFAGEHSLSSRQKQKLASELMVSLALQPEWRIKFADWALKCPGDAAKLMASQIPKEVHIEQTTQHNIVMLPPQVSAEEWLDQNDNIEDVEIVPWLTDKVPN